MPLRGTRLRPSIPAYNTTDKADSVFVGSNLIDGIAILHSFSSSIQHAVIQIAEWGNIRINQEVKRNVGPTCS